jgi:ATP dependent DNA ligase domain
VLCAFDLIELDGKDLRKAPIEQRKDLLAKVMRPVRRSHPGITLNEHYEGNGAMIYEHACRFGCEGVVSKRLGSPYRSGPTDHWLKIKNPTAPAMKREERIGAPGGGCAGGVPEVTDGLAILPACCSSTCSIGAPSAVAARPCQT